MKQVIGQKGFVLLGVIFEESLKREEEAAHGKAGERALQTGVTVGAHVLGRGSGRLRSQERWRSWLWLARNA